MVAKGIRKRFNDDIDAQMASIAQAEWQRQAELDKVRLRQSVAWYHAASGQWLEVEVERFGHKVTFTSYPEIPTRHIIEYSVTAKQTGEHHIVEAGFIADGLTHAVWVSGGKWEYDKEYGSRTCFDKDKSKCRLYQQLIVNIGKLPQIFYELYGIRISIPMIQQAFKEYQETERQGIPT